MPTISSTPLCLLPQHCLACLEGHACCKQDTKDAIAASAQVQNVLAWDQCPFLVIRASGRGQWPSASAWLLQVNNLLVWHLCLTSTELLERIKFRTTNNYLLFAIKNKYPKIACCRAWQPIFFQIQAPVDSKHNVLV
jgi:hypothetical protein